MWEVAEKKRLHDLYLGRARALIAGQYPDEYADVLAVMRRRCAGRQNARQNARSLAMGEIGRRHRGELDALIEEMRASNHS